MGFPKILFDFFLPPPPQVRFGFKQLISIFDFKSRISSGRDTTFAGQQIPRRYLITSSAMASSDGGTASMGNRFFTRRGIHFPQSQWLALFKRHLGVTGRINLNGINDSCKFFSG
jgi:hypothetical protein